MNIVFFPLVPRSQARVKKRVSPPAFYIAVSLFILLSQKNSKKIHHASFSYLQTWIGCVILKARRISKGRTGEPLTPLPPCRSPFNPESHTVDNLRPNAIIAVFLPLYKRGERDCQIICVIVHFSHGSRANLHTSFENQENRFGIVCFWLIWRRWGRITLRRLLVASAESHAQRDGAQALFLMGSRWGKGDDNTWNVTKLLATPLALRMTLALSPGTSPAEEDASKGTLYAVTGGSIYFGPETGAIYSAYR